MFTQYEINSFTLAIIPISSQTSRIVEKKDTFTVNKSSNDIISDSCQYFGSSYDGRVKGTNNLIGSCYKAPIIIEETKEIIFFPTTTTRNNNTPWISLNNIKDYYTEGKITIVEFENGTKIELDTTLGSFENQILRSSFLKVKLQKRKNN